MLFIVFFFIVFLSWLSIKRYQLFFNPFIVSLQIPFLFLVFPQILMIIFLNGEDSYLSDTVIFTFVISIYTGTYIKCPKIKIPDIKNKRLIYKFIIFLIIILAIPLIPILLRIGISFKGLRLFYEYIVFSQYSSFYAIIKTLITCIIVMLFLKYRRIKLKLVLWAFILIFSGSKMAILSTFITLATLWELYRKINYRVLFITSIFVASGMIAYHATQNRGDDIDALRGAMSYFDVYSQQTLALEKLVNNEIPYFNGDVFISSYYKIIPRFIWSDKPKDYGFALLNYKIYPEYANSNWMPSFGLAYTFADFGFISIILSGLFLGFLKNLWYQVFLYNKKNFVSCTLYILDINIVISVFLFICYLLSYLRHDSQNNSSLLA